MKKILLVAAIALAAISCEQNKIAFVDNTKLINEYQEKIDIEAKYKNKIEKFDKKTDSLSRAFQSEAQSFEAEAKSLSQMKAQEKYNALLQKRQAMSQQLQMEEQQLSQESQKEIDSLIKKVRSFVKDYAKEKGYTFVLGSNEAGSVLYGEESKDITSDVLKAINDDYKAK
ncbi:OmpH family outer membrane protein [Galbibacter mesophilus]|uniref:OmpH family outer membrane protein n=1 Tax=Galbibacter mesophilus TaxID=379069 RepID=UPI00191DE1B0|nr:OmpH family outer membrane protein [Galbibacter mesophilus]MCM5662272.1 OmpH family outer membrane protein [Galbibacter mesophilus]